MLFVRTNLCPNVQNKESNWMETCAPRANEKKTQEMAKEIHEKKPKDFGASLANRMETLPSDISRFKCFSIYVGFSSLLNNANICATNFWCFFNWSDSLTFCNSIVIVFTLHTNHCLHGNSVCRLDCFGRNWFELCFSCSCIAFPGEHNAEAGRMPLWRFTLQLLTVRSLKHAFTLNPPNNNAPSNTVPLPEWWTSCQILYPPKVRFWRPNNTPLVIIGREKIPSRWWRLIGNGWPWTPPSGGGGDGFY